MRALILSIVLVAAAAGEASAAGRPNQCFRATDYQGFKPIDEHAFVVRANVDEYFRVDVEGSCPMLTRPQAALVMKVDGPTMICDRRDWDLRVGQLGPGGFTTGCIVKSQRRLTPAEVKALPPGQRP